MQFKAAQGLTLCLLIMTIVLLILYYKPIKSLLLGIKITKKINFLPLDIVDRRSEKQPQVVENFNKFTWRYGGQFYLLWILQVQNLSGGELQRVALTLCLGKPADVYLIDEPSAYLDSEQRLHAAKVIKRSVHSAL